MIKTAVKTSIAGYGFQASLAIIAGLFILVGAQAWKLHAARTSIAEVQRDLATEREAVSRVALEAEEEARRIERTHQQAMNDLRTRLLEERQHANEERDDLLARIDSGDRRLRERFTCPTAGGGGVPGAGGSAAGSDGAETRGLSRADAGFLVRLADEADDVARQLAACQEALRIDRSR